MYASVYLCVGWAVLYETGWGSSNHIWGYLDLNDENEVLLSADSNGLMCTAGLQRSGGARLLSNEEPAALQNLWEQTRATGGQQKGAIALGAANLLGIGILSTWQGGLAALANSDLGFMLNLLPFLTVSIQLYEPY